MARRVSWTNNSSGHSGTYVYRAPTLDPQNLPEPVATVDPVAQGATAEWIDSDGAGDQCYAVQDYDSQNVGELSAEACFSIPVDDFDPNAAIGDETGGGIYAGTITVVIQAAATDFHVIVAKAAGEASSLSWGNFGIDTGTNDQYNGKLNTETVLADYDNGDSYAFYHCRDYSGGGYADWYLPATKELVLVAANLGAHPELADNVAEGNITWASSSGSSDHASAVRLSDGSDFTFITKTNTYRVRPCRRVPV